MIYSHITHTHTHTQNYFNMLTNTRAMRIMTSHALNIRESHNLHAAQSLIAVCI